MGASAEEMEAAAASVPAPSVADRGAVFDTHAAYVGRTLRCLGVRDRELADAIQDVFEVVFRKLDRVQNPDALRGWIYGICLRKARSFRRAAAKRQARTAPSEAEPACDGRSPHQALVHARALGAALRLLDELDDDKRAVFVLYEVEQLAMRDVAATVGVPTQTAYARLYAARKFLARRLGQLRAREEVER